MEAKKNYPSLPSNYVTLAQLQDRWLKQKEKEKEKEKEEEIQPKQEQQLPQREQRTKPHQQNHRQYQRRQPKPQQQAWRVIQSQGSGSGSTNGNRHPKKFRPENGNFSGINLVAVENDCENRESLKPKADDGEGKESKKRKKPKKKNVNRKPRADKEETKLAEDAAQSTMEGTKEVENSDVQKVEDKMEIKSELNDKSNNLMMVVEEKLGAVSLNSKSDKQNGRLRKPYRSFRGSQWNYGGRFGSQEAQRPRGDKKIWVRKNEDSYGNLACGT